MGIYLHPIIRINDIHQIRTMAIRDEQSGFGVQIIFTIYSARIILTRHGITQKCGNSIIGILRAEHDQLPIEGAVGHIGFELDRHDVIPLCIVVKRLRVLSDIEHLDEVEGESTEGAHSTKPKA